MKTRAEGPRLRNTLGPETDRVILLAFFFGLALLPEQGRSLLAAAYYVLHSVFSLFVISLFGRSWLIMSA